MKIPKLIEIVFDSLYLLTVLVVGFFILTKSNSLIATLYGIMAFVLLVGDAAHLIPRIFSKLKRFLGFGKMLTSITMTIFYVLLWHIGLMYYSLNLPLLTILVYIISIVRITICILPGNAWLTNDAPLKWSLYRNIPFLILGVFVIWLFLWNVQDNSIFNNMWVAITLSFLFYIPVTLFSKKYPKIGMLMLPKSCAYVWILIMGLGLL